MPASLIAPNLPLVATYVKVIIAGQPYQTLRRFGRLVRMTRTIRLPHGDTAAREERDRIMRLTGEIASDWASLEDVLAYALSALAECSDDTAFVIYYSPNNFAARLDMIVNLTKHLMPRGPERDTSIKILGKIDALSKSRNSFIHSMVGLSANARRDKTKYIHY